MDDAPAIAEIPNVSTKGAADYESQRQSFETCIQLIFRRDYRSANSRLITREAAMRRSWKCTCIETASPKEIISYNEFGSEPATLFKNLPASMKRSHACFIPPSMNVGHIAHKDGDLR